MNKQDILEAVALDIFSLEQILDEFFESNVCIPKGKRRHKDAEALHEWVEGAKIEKRPHGGSWCSTAGVNQHFDGSIRIKPSEPVYEWQWVCQEHKDTEFFVPAGWHTFEELQPSMYSLSRLEETKRERK